MPLASQQQRCSYDAVLVPRSLLRAVIADGCCPLHLRLQLARAMSVESEEQCADFARASGKYCDACQLFTGPSSSSRCPRDHDSEYEKACEAGGIQSCASCLLSCLDHHCSSLVAAYLPLKSILAARACSRDPLQWTTQSGSDDTPRRMVYDRIRVRLWMRRIAELTAGTQDESVFDTKMRNFSDEALRSRMETEMQDALAQMENQIRNFQAEVDRRLEEQESNVRRLVDERVQQELDTILAAEVRKVQELVEERVRQRVAAMFRREVRETMRELQAKLDGLAEENELLSDALAEANLRAKILFWVCHPPILKDAVACSLSRGAEVLLSLKRRANPGAGLACSWWHGTRICP